MLAKLVLMVIVGLVGILIGGFVVYSGLKVFLTMRAKRHAAKLQREQLQQNIKGLPTEVLLHELHDRTNSKEKSYRG